MRVVGEGKSGDREASKRPSVVQMRDLLGWEQWRGRGRINRFDNGLRGAERPMVLSFAQMRNPAWSKHGANLSEWFVVAIENHEFCLDIC